LGRKNRTVITDQSTPLLYKCDQIPAFKAGGKSCRPKQAKPEKAGPNQAEPEKASPEQAGPEMAGIYCHKIDS
jgi:hypothetical protein